MMLAISLLGASLVLGEPSSATATSSSSVEAAAREALAPLTGSTAFVFTELTPRGPRPLYGLRQNERFAVGSSFKLFILGALAAELNADRRQAADVMRLRPQWMGPPHSELAQWPSGSPATLHTLALKMISISDNTATDHLLHLLGRETVERQMAAMGHRHPQWNTPLLSTREMATLRDRNEGLPGKRYQTLSLPRRRKFLAELGRGQPNYDKLDFDTTAYDLAEWYATPMDMARALAWLQQHTGADRSAHPLRGVLAMVPKLPHDEKIWPYVGFKGGSEDQLIAGNWLLKNRKGRWYTFHVYWNSPDQKVEVDQMLKAVETLFARIQQEIP